jgi:hypothetical protein
MLADPRAQLQDCYRPTCIFILGTGSRRAEKLDEPPKDGVYIHGFFINGARYNREEQVIDDQLPVRQ